MGVGAAAKPVMKKALYTALTFVKGAATLRQTQILNKKAQAHANGSCRNKL